jgi:sialate O-acetylesterase
MRTLTTCVAASFLGGAACAQVKLPAIFSDHMVLQGNRTIPVWGTAKPGEKVKVTLGKDRAKTKSDEEGNWRVSLKAIEPGTNPLTMTVEGTNTVTFSDVLIGDVWVASGQSNMAFPLSDANSGAQAIKTGNHPLIRLFIVPHATAVKPQSDIGPIPAAQAFQGKWMVCAPETLAGGFSAVAYFFGRDIQNFTGLPVGLIDTAWGGTPAEAWTSYEGLQSAPQLAIYAGKHQQLLDGYEAAQVSHLQKLREFQAEHDEWSATSNPKNDAALAKWATDNAAALASGQPAIPRPAMIPEPREPALPVGPGSPAVLFNGMITPLIPYGIKGAIWYQGESNGGRGLEYRYLFRAMIQSWRDKWGQGDFPFLYVQLPDSLSQWELLRESQLDTLSLPNTGMAVTIDVGTIKNLHPPFKEIVGHRLALVGEHVAYGKDVDYAGPMYKSMLVEGATIRITFNHAEGLKIGTPPVSGPDTADVPRDKLVSFTIAAADRQWHPAEARIDGNTVVVSSADVKEPVAVRFGWNPPSVCNLYNKAELPASPFRTDDWQ